MAVSITAPVSETGRRLAASSADNSRICAALVNTFGVREGVSPVAATEPMHMGSNPPRLMAKAIERIAKGTMWHNSAACKDRIYTEAVSGVMLFN
jgi:hypothetical protein